MGSAWKTQLSFLASFLASAEQTLPAEVPVLPKPDGAEMATYFNVFALWHQHLLGVLLLSETSSYPIAFSLLLP